MDKLLAASRSKWFWLSHHHGCPVSAARAALLSSQSAFPQLSANHHHTNFCCINCFGRNFSNVCDFCRYATSRYISSDTGSHHFIHRSVSRRLGQISSFSDRVNSSFLRLVPVACRNFHSSSVDFARTTGYSNFGHKRRPVSKWSNSYSVFLATMFLFFFCLNGYHWLVEKTNMDGTPAKTGWKKSDNGLD